MPVAVTPEAHKRAVQQAQAIDSLRSHLHAQYAKYSHDEHGFHAGLASAAPLSKDFGAVSLVNVPEMPQMQAPLTRGWWLVEPLSEEDLMYGTTTKAILQHVPVPVTNYTE